MTKAGWMMAAALALAPTLGAPLQAAPPAGGTISIEAKGVDAELAPSLPAFVTAISDALYARGFTMLDQPGHAAYVAEVDLSRVEVGTGSAHVSTSGSSVEPGGVGSSVGVGVRIPLPTGKSTLVPLQRTRMEIHIVKRGEQAPVWHGAAITVRSAGTKKGQDDVVAAALAEALLRAYPAQPEDVVGVP